MKNRLLLFVIPAIGVVFILSIGLSEKRQVLAKSYSLEGNVEITTSTPLGTSFSYQGYLEHNQISLNGIYHFSFELFDAETGGDSFGYIEVENVDVVDGVFTALLEFDPGVFDGEELWLEIGFQPSSGTGGYTVLPGRQPVTPVPYAIYAVQGGYVEWSDISHRPAGLDDGDDDTRYYAGYGLDLDGTTFNVIADTIQARAANPCEAGSTIITFNADGTVECEPHDTKPGFSLNTLDIIQTGFFYNSMTIGSDGLPIICYNDENAGDFNVAHCNDIACTSASIFSVDPTDDVGSENSITIGKDGLPVISYYDYYNHDLKVAHCNDVSCTNASYTTVDSAGDVGSKNSITIGSDGLPVISYYDSTNQSLNVAHCNDHTCTSVYSNTLDYIGDIGDGGRTSITIGADGLPVISYNNLDLNYNLKVALCTDIACTNAITRTLDTDGNVGFYNSITIGTDGLPVVSYFDVSNHNLKVAHCNNIACTSFNITAVDTIGSVGWYTSISIGSNGLPVINYIEWFEVEPYSIKIKVSNCHDFACTSASNVIVLTTYDGILYATSAIGVDGYPVISYSYNTPSTELNVIHCSNQLCIPYWRRR